MKGKECHICAEREKYLKKVETWNASKRNKNSSHI